MIYYETAQNAEEIARLLRSRGRIVITAPPRSGKTTELLRYAEERYPNGRFAVVCGRKEDHKYILKLHWNIYNDISFVDVVAKRLLGEKLEGEDVNTPLVMTLVDGRNLPANQTIPIFCDEWNLLTEPVQRAIMRRKLFIAATTS